MAMESEMKKLYLLAVLLAGSLIFSSGAFASIGNQVGGLTGHSYSYQLDFTPNVTWGWNWNWNFDWDALLDWWNKYREQHDQPKDDGGYHSVPEIDAAGAIIALSLMAGLFALIRERKLAIVREG